MRLDQKTILFQGDSITDMSRGRNLWDQNHLYGHSFVFHLASLFGCEMPEKRISLLNRGVSGDTIADMWARWEEDALALKPNVISILVGINDLIHLARNEPGASPEEYAATLVRMIECTRKANPNTDFVLCEPFASVSSAGDIYKSTFSANLPAYREAAREVAKQHQAIFVPLQSVFEEAYRAHPTLPESHWIWDGIHPTAAGHRLIAKQWLACVTEGITL